MQRDLGKIASCCRQNEVSLNIKKTKNILFGSRHKLKHTKCDKLEFVSQHKYLGVILTKHLKNVIIYIYIYIYIYIIRIVSHTINLLAKVRDNYLDNQANLLIYRTMILPYFDYGDTFFMKSQKHLLSTCKKSSKNLSAYNRRCARKCAINQR